MIIYKITNKLDGKCYIGKTSRTIEKRWREHRNQVKSKKTYYLHYAIKKYGEENFTIEIIKELNCLVPAHLNHAERYFIKKYKSNDPEFGYNMTLGGDGFEAGHETSRQHRKRISLKKIKFYELPENREITRKALKKYYKEHPEKVNRGPRTKEVLKKIRDGVNKYFEDPQHRIDANEKISKAKKKYYEDPQHRIEQRERSLSLVTPETKKQMSDFSKKLWEEPNHKQYMSETMTEYWADPKNRKAARKRWEKMLTDPEWKEQHSENISNSQHNKWTPEYRKRMSEIIKETWKNSDDRRKQTAQVLKENRKKIIYKICPYCNRSIDPGNYKLYHGENCDRYCETL